jgi:hypothetical protein
MKLFVAMKHWQLFILLFLSVLFMTVASLFTIFYFAWILAISIYITKKLPSSLKILSIILKSLTAIAILLLVFKAAYVYYLTLTFNANSDTGNDGMSLFNSLLSNEIIISFYILPVLYIVFSLAIAKLFKSAETNSSATFSEYAGDFFMFLFSIIGLWILQPRINTLVAQSNEEVISEIGS